MKELRYLLYPSTDSRFCSSGLKCATKRQSILHRGADLFQKDPILLEFALPESGLVIVGNLDGEISDLLTVMRTLGFPPQKHYLFLGSYIDRENRGPYQMEEVFDCNYECGFAELCNQTFRNNKIYGVFSGTFDVMPLAAIVGG
uniref:protein-serine/threonine phosphatase n=1 Tax=Parascaris equorum TaxID=6256 RepID=A0A914RBP5_PAREQ